jgi:hypothetical protein
MGAPVVRRVAPCQDGDPSDKQRNDDEKSIAQPDADNQALPARIANPAESFVVCPLADFPDNDPVFARIKRMNTVKGIPAWVFAWPDGSFGLLRGGQPDWLDADALALMYAIGRAQRERNFYAGDDE